MKTVFFRIPAAMVKLNNFVFLVLFGLAACSQNTGSNDKINKSNTMTINKSEEEWKQVLTPVQFSVLRQKGTERPFSGEYDEFFDEGDYYCAGCGALLFHSSAKYNSGCGWPAFFEPADSSNFIFKKDLSHGMVRTEVMCAHCGGHLGHVFDDGPRPTGVRYCINSVSMQFKPSPGKDNTK